MLLLSGCIRNDIPYPVVTPHILSLEVQGAKSVSIDQQKRTVSIVLEETVDLHKVKILGCEVDEKMTQFSRPLSGNFDLSEPVGVVLTTYQQYPWTIEATRPIERYFTVDGQVGSSAIDDVNHRAIAYVSKKVSLSNITVKSLKLGPEGLTTYSIPMEKMKNFTNGIEVEVKYFNEVDYWSLYVEVTDIAVSLKEPNAWAREVYLSADGIQGQKNGFKYRKLGDEWTDVSMGSIDEQGGHFSAHITALEPDSDYECYAYTGSDMTDVKTFHTEKARQLPNSGFEHVSLVSGKAFYKWYDPSCSDPESQSAFWGSGNGDDGEPGGIVGSGSMGIVITVPDETDKVEGERSVCARSGYIVGMLTAGNIFTGHFAGLVGTKGGIVDFGRPWNTRPKALKLWVKYTTDYVDVQKDLPPGVSFGKDDMDRASIRIALGTWDYRKYGGTAECPVRVNTTKSETFVDYYKDPSTLANGELVIFGEGYQTINGGEKTACETTSWHEVTIPFDYRDLEKLPTHIVVSCSAAYFGDYFTGSSKSKLWIDKAELVY